MMAPLTNNTTRNVVPNWRDYKTTAVLGELDGNNAVITKITLFSIHNYVKAWEENQTAPFAGDLISAAIMNGQRDNASVLKAAKFIVERGENMPESLYKVALSILPSEKEMPKEDDLSISEQLNSIITQEQITKERIRFLRNLTHRFPYNPIWYNELSLAYANLGLMTKAKDMMKIAVHLAPESRYITRSAARLFLHAGDADRAHAILINNPAIIKDPWIVASEIAVNASRGRSSRYIKSGISMINSCNYSPFSLTELASAIGTVEHHNSLKKCQLYIDKALTQPNDNSLSQAEWLLSVDNSIRFKFTDYSSIKNKYEADARRAFFSDDYKNALATSVKWIKEMPFAKTPIYFAAELAYTFQKDYETAINILKVGLKSNPNELAFLNNLAYVYAINGETDKSDQVLYCNSLNSAEVSTELKICIIATKGLNEYRKGNIEAGRNHYKEAISMAQNASDQNLLHKALLNFIREEVRTTKIRDKSLLSMIDNLYTGNIRETKIMRQDIIDLLDKI